MKGTPGNSVNRERERDRSPHGKRRRWAKEMEVNCATKYVLYELWNHLDAAQMTWKPSVCSDPAAQRGKERAKHKWKGGNHNSKKE